MVDCDAEGCGGAVKDHAEAAGVGLDDAGKRGAAGEPRFRRFAPDEVEAWGEGHHHARAAVVLCHGLGDQHHHCQNQHSSCDLHLPCSHSQLPAVRPSGRTVPQSYVSRNEKASMN